MSDFEGPHPDPDELRALAAATDAGEPGWRSRVDALPANVLTPETLASEPGVIARQRNGAPFGKKAGEPFYESWLT